MSGIPFLSVVDATAELREEIDRAISRVVSSGHYIGGPEVEAFELEFARFVGARHCVGVGNGLDAITLALRAHGVGAGSEVIVPSNTFIATWLGATHAGATPVPVEPDFATHVVTVEALERAITPRTRVLLPVHLYGLPVDMRAIRELARERGLVLLDDAAQAHGATVFGRRVGGFGNSTTWSFYPGKNLGALGDAGAITTDDDLVAEELLSLRNYGSTTKYIHDSIGYNTRLDPIQAAVLRVKLHHLDAWNARRVERARQYEAGLAGLGDLRLPAVPANRTHVFHLYVIRTGHRDALRDHLDRAGIGTVIHYPRPPHEQKAYANARLHGSALLETSREAGEVLSLPMGPHLSEQSAQRVVDAIRAFFGRNSSVR